MPDLGTYRRHLSGRFAAAFADRAAPRQVGREAEYPVADTAGQPVDVRQLLAACRELGPYRREYKDGVLVGLSGPEHAFFLEVGLSTVEVVTRPCADLHELAQIHDGALDRLTAAASGLGWSLLGLGLHPTAEPSPVLMTAKPHYQAFRELLGDPWLWFTVTAGDQLHTDVAAGELVDVLNVTNALVPMVVALCGNSPVSAGRKTGIACYRESRMQALLQERDRYGMHQPRFASVEELIDHILGTRYLVRRRAGGYEPVDRPFWEWLIMEQPDLGRALDDFAFHDHYNWHSSRARLATGTIEQRAACQQPPDQQMAAAALYLSIVEAHERIAPLVETTLRTYGLANFYRQALVCGLDLEAPLLEAIGNVLELCHAGLRTRQRGEEKYLEPLFDRLANRRNPGQRAALRYDEEGLPGLLAGSVLSRGEVAG